MRTLSSTLLLVSSTLVAGATAGDAILSFTPNWNGSSGQAASEYGQAVAGVGDLNGDGFGDAIVGAPAFSNGQTWEGRAFAYYGTATGLPNAANWTIESDQAFAALGASVAAAGDVNGDGFADVVVGVPDWDGPQNDEGRVLVFHGSAAGLAATPDWTWESDAAGARAGAAVAGAGDVNGDGFDDVIVAASGFGGGAVHIFHGSAVGLGAAAASVLVPGVSNTGFGRGIAGAGDVNGDGFDDVIVGAPTDEQGETDEGIARVYLGSAAGVSTTASWSAQSDVESALFGLTVDGAGDVDGDGFGDVIVGAPYCNATFQREGRASLFRGSASGLQLAPAWTASGDAYLSAFAWSVAGVGDLNADGRADVIVGAPEYNDGNIDEGRAFVFLGSSTGLETLPAWSVKKNEGHAHLGASVDGAGDVNGDGLLDVIVGGHLFDNGKQFAHVFHGGPYGAATPYGFGKGLTFNAPPRLFSLLAPRIGQNASLLLQGGVGQAGPTFMFVGFQPAQLAFDEGTLWVLPFAFVPLPNLLNNGSFLHLVSIPNDPSLLDLDVYFQAGFVQAGASGFYGTVLTNGLRWTLGN